MVEKETLLVKAGYVCYNTCLEVIFVANYGGFYKGDKKKPKKETLEKKASKVESTSPSWGSPTFSLPQVLPKGKNKEE